MLRSTGFLFGVGLALFCLLSGCATPPPASDPDALAEYRQTNDPLEPTNRAIYAVNDALDTAVIRPVAQAYIAVVPAPGREGVHNMLANASTPVRLASDVLQGKPRRAGDTVMRFLINTTVGVLGAVDVAKDWGYPPHDADFGTTLALWGLPDGPYVMLPILGPSSVRDTLGFGGDVAASPFAWVGHGAVVLAIEWARVPVFGIDARARHGADIDSTKHNALDPYATFRSLYRQLRADDIEKQRNDRPATVPVWFARSP